jgi:hypothetical protein
MGYDPSTGNYDKSFPATAGASGVDVCDDLHAQGTVLTEPLYDNLFWTNVAKCSLGDIDLSPDGSTLYVTSLMGRDVLSFDTATGAMTDKDTFQTSRVPDICPNPATDAWRRSGRQLLTRSSIRFWCASAFERRVRMRRVSARRASAIPRIAWSPVGRQRQQIPTI